MIEFFPWPFAAGLIILLSAAIQQRKKGKAHLFGLTLFGLYLLAAVAAVFFPIPYAQNWPANLTWADTSARLARINWIPGEYGTLFLFEIPPWVIFWEFAGNVLLTVPFGFFVSALTPVRGRRLVVLALLTGFSIEALQLVIGLLVGYYYHSVDINDVLLNALGVLVGAGVYWVGKKAVFPLLFT